MNEIVRKYEAIMAGIKAFKAENAELLMQLEALEDTRDKLEKELKVYAAENGDVDSESYKATVSQPYKKWYDPEVLKSDLSAWKFLRNAGAVTETVEVDRAKVEELVRDEKISRELVAKAFREEQMTARVSIKIK